MTDQHFPEAAGPWGLEANRKDEVLTTHIPIALVFAKELPESQVGGNLRSGVWRHGR